MCVLCIWRFRATLAGKFTEAVTSCHPPLPYHCFPTIDLKQRETPSMSGSTYFFPLLLCLRSRSLPTFSYYFWIWAAEVSLHPPTTFGVLPTTSEYGKPKTRYFLPLILGIGCRRLQGSLRVGGPRHRGRFGSFARTEGNDVILTLYSTWIFPLWLGIL